MKVPERFHITIRGTRLRALEREHVQEQLGYRLAQLITYSGEIPDDFLRPWGLAVDVEEDTDQGDDG